MRSPSRALIDRGMRLKLSPHEERRVAVEARVHPSTVRAYVAHRGVRFAEASRIEEALRALGLAPPSATTAA